MAGLGVGQYPGGPFPVQSPTCRASGPGTGGLTGLTAPVVERNHRPGPELPCVPEHAAPLPLHWCPPGLPLSLPLLCHFS